MYTRSPAAAWAGEAATNAAATASIAASAATTSDLKTTVCDRPRDSFMFAPLRHAAPGADASPRRTDRTARVDPPRTFVTFDPP